MMNENEIEQIPEPKPSVNWFRRIAIGTGVTLIGVMAFVFWPIVHVQISHLAQIDQHLGSAGYPAVAYPDQYVIVLGASVKSDGTPSDALYDRILTGVELYPTYAKKLLMTGDDGKFHANEVAVMKRVAMELGVPEEDILVDGQGYRTYESCKRAKQVLHIDRAIIVTQRFHLGRAMYLCDQFGIDVQGISADRQSYQRIMFFWARDLVSSFKAWWDINVIEPKPPVDESERD